MRTEIIKSTTDNIHEVARAAGAVLKGGGIVAFPTDTVYGLGAVYTDESAVASIFAAKGRDEKKPLSILIADKEQAALLSDNIPEAAYKLMDAFWPGALTIIVSKNDSVGSLVAAGGSSVGIRMPKSLLAREIIRAAEAPLAAPSANTSGKRSSIFAEDVIEDLNGRVDMIIDGGRCDIGLSSTVIDMSGTAPRILREGSISEEKIKK